MLVALVVAALAITWWIFREHSEAQAPIPAQASAPGTLRLTPVQWASLTVEPVGTRVFDSVLTTDGTVVVNDDKSVAVYSQFSGRVLNVFARAGQAVRKGAPLASILAVEAAQSRSDTAAAAAAEATSLKQLELARATEERQHQLFLAQAGAEKDWLQSKVDLVAAENVHRAAVVALTAARDKTAILGEQSSQDTDNAQMPRRAGGAGQTVITAPIDGLIVQRQIAAGQYVNSLASGGSAPLFTVTDSRTVWVVAYVSEAQATNVKMGQSMDVRAFALPGRIWRGQVTWISSNVDPSSHRIGVRSEIANDDSALKPQMNVTARLLDDQAHKTLAIPRSAIVFDGSEAHCFVVTAERTLTSKKLELGRVDSELAEVKAGLLPGDRVVTRGALFIDRATEDSAS